MYRHLTFIGLVVALLLPQVTYATSADSCRQRTNKEMAREQRLYRSYLFGKRNAKDASVNSVRYDTDGWAWMKVDNSETPWRNSHPENQDLEWSNTVMDNQDEHADVLPLIGIFETKRVTTSELIPYLLQTTRAFECRLAALCDIVQVSQTQTEEEKQEIASVRPLGCISYSDLHTWPECHFGVTPEAVTDTTDALSYCTDMAKQLLDREQELLKLAVEYDAGYRSLLQFAGNFDIFLRELRWPLTQTLRNAVGLLGQLERIPCFLSSCDASPPARQ